MGSGFSDMFLLSHASKIIKDLTKLAIVEKWFFVRYSDPHFHIRIRIKLLEIENLAAALQIITKNLTKLLKCRLIWKMEFCTYFRELERYNGLPINSIESIFMIQSRYALKMMNYTRVFPNIVDQTAIILSILNDFLVKMSRDRKTAIFQRLFELQKGKKDKVLNSMVKIQFRKSAIYLDFIYFNSCGTLKPNQIHALQKFVKIKALMLAELDQILSELVTLPSFDDHINILRSLLHMFVNKLYETSNLQREEVLLGLIIRLEASITGRSKYFKNSQYY